MTKNSREVSMFTYALQQEILCFLNVFDEVLHERTRRIPLFKDTNDEDTKLKGIPGICPKTDCIKTHDCKECGYHKDYFLLVRNCVSRDKENSLWEDIIIYGPFEFGGMGEYITVIVAGKKKGGDPNCYSYIATLCDDRSKLTYRKLDYYDVDAQKDNYALTMIIEALRIIL